MLFLHRNKAIKIRSPFCVVAWAGAAIFTLLWFSTANAQLFGSSLRAFEGTWGGTGTLMHQDGVTERIRCRVRYILRGAQSLEQTLQCTSDTTNFNIVSTISDESGRLTGDWTETTRGARGTLAGTLSGDQLSAQVRGPNFSAGIGIAVRGNRQSVNIRASGTDISSLNMTLTRTSR